MDVAKKERLWMSFIANASSSLHISNRIFIIANINSSALSCDEDWDLMLFNALLLGPVRFPEATWSTDSFRRPRWCNFEELSLSFHKTL